MLKITPITFSALLAILSGYVYAAPVIDSQLVGSWEGTREQNGKCQFLSWKSIFKADGQFSITFFRDAEKNDVIQTENGQWSASNGKNILKTDGVATAEVYEYTLIDSNTVHYVNTVKDPSADCQEDYEFTEYRVQ